MEKINGWETKTLTRLFRLKRQEDETLVDYLATTCNMARKIWMQMGLFFLCEKMQKVCGVPWDGCAMKNRML